MNTPIVCYVTDRKSSGLAHPSGGVLENIAAAMEAGADWVQIREKDLPVRELLTLAGTAVEMRNARSPAMRVILNDRLDVAIAAGADGVHLGGDSMDIGDVARWRARGNAPAEFLIGVSCHSLEEARRASESGASYIFFGPIFDTPSKRSFGTPQGLERLAEACSGAAGVPVIAIGGMGEENGAACIRAGAAGVAAIRLFQERRDAGALARAVDRLHKCAG